MVEKRHKSILETLVREYIKTAEPVSSQRVAECLGDTLSPATVRNVFTELTENGYIEQPHISGGRIPKISAYRFFVNQILDGAAATTSMPKAIIDIATESIDNDTVQDTIARHLHLVSRFGDTMPRGFEEIFSEPEFRQQDLLHEFGLFLDEFESSEEHYREILDPGTYTVFIGYENLIQQMQRISLIIGKGSDHELFFIAGSTRMRYDCIIHLMTSWKRKPIRTTILR